GAPGPGEDELLVRNHLAIDATHVGGVAGHVHDDAVAAADPQVGLRVHLGDALRSEPGRYFRRVGPGRVDFGGRRIETTFKGEAGLGGDVGLGGGHVSSAANA